MRTIVRQLVQWRLYTRRRGLKLDLVILDERVGELPIGYERNYRPGAAGEMLGKPGGVFFLTADKVPADERSCSRPPRGLCSAVVAGR